MSKESLTQKIEKVEKAISRNREQYEKLHQEQKAIQSQELLKAISESSRSFEDIMRYIQGDGD